MGAGLARLAMGGLLVYFSWHALAGDHGLARWMGLQREAVQLRAEIAVLEQERAALKVRIARLQDDDPDLDYIDDIARGRLRMAHPDDIIVVWPEDGGAGGGKD